MAKIALINIDMHGHVNPTLGLTSELKKRGHKVYFYSSNFFKTRIISTGAEFVNYPTAFGKLTEESAQIQALATAEGKAPPKEASAMSRFLFEFSETFPFLQKSLSDLKPDLIIYDFVSLAARIIAKNLHIPAIKFFTTYASNEHYDLLSQSFAKHDYPSQDELNKAQLMIDKFCHGAGYHTVELAKEARFVEEKNLVFLPRTMQPKAEFFDDRFVFVGPCFQQSNQQFTRDNLPPGDGPLLLISMGSVFHAWKDFYKECISAFGNSSWRVVMAIGPEIQQDSLGMIPENIRVYQYIPQVALLPAADLFISHGGMNSTMEALSFGVPLIMIPQIEEQIMTAEKIQNLELGKMLDRSKINKDVLRNASIEVMQSESIRINLKEFQRTLLEAGGPIRAADFVTKEIQKRNFLFSSENKEYVREK